jgi:sulfopyruvate decarboxylase subunit alpha
VGFSPRGNILTEHAWADAHATLGPSMFTGPEIAELLADLRITHVIWLPDSGLGAWEAALESSAAFRLVRVAREAEAWAIAAGLQIGGARPLVIMQTTGLFDSGDSLRNALFDLGLPLFAIVGHRSYLVENSIDTAKQFAEPILRAWGIDYVLLSAADELPRLREHFLACQSSGKPGIALVAEGRM